MEAVNGGSLGGEGGPPPPSPLTGCYLLVVVGEPHSQEHKDIILQKIAKGLLSWDVNECLVDLEKELAIITEQGLEGEEARFGERLIQFASENLVTEILIHPAVSTLSQCVRNLLSSFTRHRHIIHAGYTFQGNGSWALQDGTFSYSDFAEAFQEIEVQRVIHAYENGISIDLHCAPEGEWTRLPKEYFAKACKVRVNPTDVLTTGSPSISGFTKYLEPFLVPTVLEDILESSDVVGNIRFSRPTLYVFPGGQGDAALFGINGFNMLLDGGYSRKACFWDFVRHLDRLDAVLMSRLNNSSVSGISSVLKRKRQGAVYPQIGHFFCNIQERKSILSPDGDKDKDPLIINLLEEGQNIIHDLKHLNLFPQSCYRDSDPIILYHKVGHGTLNMFVLSPDKNSKEVREFLQKWNQSDSKLFSLTKPGKEFNFPLQNLVSICALLVWQPSNPNDTITRILYPGSAPQRKIFEGLDRLKSVEYMKHPTCTVRTFTSVKKTKQDVLDKFSKDPKAPLISEKKTENKALLEESKKSFEMNGDVIRDKQEVNEKTKRIEDLAKVIENGEKRKSKPKATPEVKTKPKEDAQQKKKPVPEKKGPSTPKKTLENKKNGDVINRERKIQHKPSPDSTPAKSAKDASNRKVIESKKAPQKKETTPKAPPADAKPKPERKPISRRPKTAKGPPSPSKKPSQNGTQKPDSLFKRGKLDKEGTTDSSTVSTPSADQDSILKKDISKLTPEEIQQLKEQEMEELKEEQEVNKEIEAVFRKSEAPDDESEHGAREIKGSSIEEQLMETEEYLIVEKEEIDHDSLDQEAKEDEMQKLVRDSEESEKQRKLSSEEDKKSKKHVITSPEGTDKKEEEVKVESQPEEKVSANVESGATTTAPTLPEDERMTLDEIKEDNKDSAVEEKHIKEDTKEKEEVPPVQPPMKQESKQAALATIPLDKQKHMKDIVKTPDEVADLPMHEEADYHDFQADDKKKDDATKPTDPKSHSLEKRDVLEKADTETKEKPDQDNNLVADLKETIDDDEWVVITKQEEESKLERPQESLDLSKTKIEENVVVHKINEKLQKDKESEIDCHEVRKEDEIQEPIDEVKEDIKALLEEADKKPIQDQKLEKEDDKICAIKESKKEIAALDNKIQELKKDVSIPVGEMQPPTKDLTKIEEPPTVHPKEILKDVAKIDDKLTDLKSPREEIDVEIANRSPQHAEAVTLPDSSPEDDGPRILRDLDIDKAELGRKSPAEREEDVKKIVVSVAEVLKSDAPLEELQGKPIAFAVELKETHITTQDSPIIEAKIIKTDDIPPIPEETAEDDAKTTKDPAVLDDETTVHRMLVTASSEDGGEEIEICPVGSITFSRSSESSGRSSPEPSQKTHKSSVVETDSVVTAKQIDDPSEEIKQVVGDKAELSEATDVGEKTDSKKEEKAEPDSKSGDATENRQETSSRVIDKSDFVAVKSESEEKIVSNDTPIKKADEKSVEATDLSDELHSKATEETTKPVGDSKKEDSNVPIGEAITAPNIKDEAGGLSETISSAFTSAEQKLEDTLEYIEGKAASFVDTFTHSRKESIDEHKVGEFAEEHPQRRQSIIEKAEELFEKSEEVVASVGHKAQSILEGSGKDNLQKTEESKKVDESVAGKRPSVSETTSKIVDTEKEHEKPIKSEDVSKEPSPRRQSIIEKAEEFLGKSEEAFEEVIASIGNKAHSILDGFATKDELEEKKPEKKTSISESPLNIVDTEKPTGLVPELPKNEEDKKSVKPEDVEESVQSRQSIIERAEELIGKSEEALEEVSTSISDKAHSALDGLSKEDELQKTEEQKKLDDSAPEKRPSVSEASSKTADAGKASSVVPELHKGEQGDKPKLQEDVGKHPSQRRQSIVEKAEEYLEKSEKALEEVAASIGNKAHHILNEFSKDGEVRKTEEENKLADSALDKRPSVSESDSKTADAGKGSSVVPDLHKDEQGDKPIHQKDVGKEPSQRRPSIVEKAEEFFEKSEKALEEVAASIGNKAHSILNEFSHDSEVKKTEEENKLADSALDKRPSVSEADLKTADAGKASSVVPELHKDEHGDKLIHQEDAGKEPSQRRQSIVEKAEEFLEKSEEALEEVAASIGNKAHSILNEFSKDGEVKKTEEEEKVADSVSEKRPSVSDAHSKTADQGKASSVVPELHKDEKGDTPINQEDVAKEPSQRRQSIVEKAEEFLEKSEKAFEEVAASIGDKAHSILNEFSKENELKKSEEQKKVGASTPEKRPSIGEADSKVADAKQASSVVLELHKVEEGDKAIHQEHVVKEPSHRRQSIVEKAEEFLEKSEEAFEQVAASIGEKAHSILNEFSKDGVKKIEEDNKLADSPLDKRPSVSEASSNVADAEKSSSVVPELHKDEEDDKLIHQEDAAKESSQRRQSIVEKAKEFLEKSEEAFEEVAASIGDKAHSILNEFSKEGEVKKTEEEKKHPGSAVEKIEKSLQIVDADKASGVVPELHKVDEDKKPLEAEDGAKEFPQKRDSTIEKTSELLAKSEEITAPPSHQVHFDSSAFSKEEVKKIAEQETSKTESPLVEKKSSVTEASAKVVGEGKTTSMISELHQDEKDHKLEELQEEPKQRRQSIIEKAEELFERSEKAFEDVIGFIGHSAHVMLDGFRKEDDVKKEQELVKSVEPTKSELSSIERKSSIADNKLSSELVSEGPHKDEGKPDEKTILEKRSSIVETSQDQKITSGAEIELHKEDKSLPVADLKPAEKDTVKECSSPKDPKDVKTSSELVTKDIVDKEEKISTEEKKPEADSDTGSTKIDSTERRGSIIEAAEEFIAKSEKTLEGGAPMTVLHDVLPEEPKEGKDVKLVGEEKHIKEAEQVKDISHADDAKVETKAREDDNKTKSVQETIDTSLDKSHVHKEATKSTEEPPAPVSSKKSELPDETYVVGEDTIEKEEKQIEQEVKHLNENIENLTELSKSVSFDKCKPLQDFKLNKETLEMEEKYMEDTAEELRRSYDDLSKLSDAVVFDKCPEPSDEFKLPKEALKKEERQLEEEADHLRHEYEDLSKLAESIPFEKCKSADEYKFDKETLKKEERQAEDEANALRRSYEDLTKLSESVSFDKCKGTDEFKLDEATLKKEERQIEDEAIAVERNLEDLSKFNREITFEKCNDEYKFDKDILEKEGRQMEDEADALRRSYEDLSKLAESSSFEKCHLADEFKLKEDVREKEEKQMEEGADALRRTYEGLSKLAESTTFGKCKISDEFRLEKDVLERDERQLEEVADALRKSYEDLAKLADATPFDKCKISDQFKLEKEEKQLEKDDKCKISHDYKVNEYDLTKEGKQMENEAEFLKHTYDHLNQLSGSVCFDKCKVDGDLKVDDSVLKKEEKEASELTKSSHKIDEDFKEDETIWMKGDKHMEEEASALKKDYADLKKLAESVSFDKCRKDEDFKLDESVLKKEEKQKEQEAEAAKENYHDLSKTTKSVSFENSKPAVEDAGGKGDSDKIADTIQKKIVLSQDEKSDKESAEKTFEKDVDDTKLKVDRSGEPKKLSISDVEISIKTDSDHKAASQSFLDYERAVICDSTDAKVFVPCSEDGSSALAISTSPGTGASSIKSSSEPDLSGKTTPPTVPISPVAKEGKLASIKSDSGLNEQETDDEDLSTKSQVAHSQSDLDELDMKLDPMSTSFYGALPKEFDEPDVPPTYLYEITRAKYTSDITFDDDRMVKEDIDVMTTSFYGGPSTTASSGQAIDSWGQPPAPSYLYEATKAKYASGSEEDVMTRSFIGEQLPSMSQEKEQDPMTTSVYFDPSTDPIASWGKPLGLPSPAPPNNNNSTPKKEKKLPSYVTAKNKLNDDKKRSESPSKLKARRVNPVYVDLTYVPHQGNHYYSFVDFFRRIRARYYVFSGLEPSRQVYDALLEAKQTWEDKDLEVTIIPTYDTDILGYWVAENEDLLGKFKIDLAPSASRCTINLQDHETSCSAYRLEF